MKIQFKKIELILFTILLSISTSCNKESFELNKVELTNINTVAQQWLVNESAIRKSNGTNLFIDSIISGIEYKNTFLIEKNNQSSIAVISINYNEKKIGLILSINNRTNKVNYVLMVDAKFSNCTFESFFKSIFSENYPERLTGSATFYNIDNKFLSEIGYKEGKKDYEKYLQKSNHLSSGSIVSNSENSKKVKSNACYEFYLVTYWSDGSTTRVFLGISCDGGGIGGCEQTGRMSKNGSNEISFSCEEGGGGSPANPSGGNSSNTNNDGPKICWSSLQFTSQGVGSDVNNAKVWGIPASYHTPNGIFAISFGIEIFSSNQIQALSGVKYALSILNYFSLWTDGDITQNNNGSVIYSAYAQKKIIVDACDYASFQASNGVTTGETVTSNAYKADFRSYFNEWINQYLPGATMNMLHGTTTGATAFRSTYGDPSNCQ